MTTPGVDFFRVDRSGTTKRWLLAAGLMVTCGASAIGAHLVHRLPAQLSHYVSLAGGVSVLGGLVLGFGAMAMMIFEDVYLAIREEGLFLHDNGRETTIRWEELDEVRVEASQGFVELRAANREAVRWFAGKGAPDMAARIDDAKRKAAHGLLRVDEGSIPPTRVRR